MHLNHSPGVPPLTPQSHELMEQMWPEVRAVHIAKLPLDGASSPSGLFLPYSPSELPSSFNESLTLNAPQNPSAPLPSQNGQLLGDTFQSELQGSTLPDPVASDTQPTDMATTNTPQHSNRPDQSFHGQRGHGTGLWPPWASMDTEPPFNQPLNFGPLYSPQQIPEDIMSTMGPLTSKGIKLSIYIK